MKPPEFKTGNKSFASALSQVVEYAKRHGINPAGRPGWSETADGWQPPAARPGAVETSSPWDLIKGSGSGLVTVRAGSILKSLGSVQQVLTLANADDEFEPADGGFLAIRIDDESPTSYELELLDSWPEDNGFTVSYTGTIAAGTFAFTSRYFPLWKFTATKSDAVSFTVSYDSNTQTGVYGIRIAPFENLAVIQSLYKTPDEEYVTLPLLIPYCAAI